RVGGAVSFPAYRPLPPASTILAAIPAAAPFPSCRPIAEDPMNRAILVALGTGAIITSAAAIGIGAAREAPRGAMSRSEYHAALAAIERSRPDRALACEAMAAAARET